MNIEQMHRAVTRQSRPTTGPTPQKLMTAKAPSFFASCLAAIALSASAVAQFPVLSVLPNPSNPQLVDFNLADPTSLAGRDPYVMLVCYASLTSGPGKWSNLIRSAIQAVDDDDGEHSTQNSYTAQINGVSATAEHANDYWVPPYIIAEAVAEIEETNWGNTIEGWAREFKIPHMMPHMPWPVTGWNNSSTMGWSSLGTGGQYDLAKMLRACLARQIGYQMSLPPDDTEVESRVDAVMGQAETGSVTFALNAIAVEIIDPTTGNKPTPVTVKLSRTSKIDITFPATGSEPPFFHFDYIYPVNPNGDLTVDSGVSTSSLLAGGPFELFLPTDTGWVAMPATVVDVMGTWGYRVTNLPLDIKTEQFAVWDVGTSSYMWMPGPLGPTQTNWIFRYELLPW